MNLSRSILLVALGIAAAAPGYAQSVGFEAQQLHPAPGRSTNYINAESARTPGNGNFEMALFMNYANSFFGLYAEDEVERSVRIHQQYTAHLLADLGLTDRLELGVDVPVVLSQDGDPTPELGSDGGGPVGLGDLRILLKVRLFGPAPSDEDPHGFGIALAVDAFVPTGDESRLQGDPTARAMPRLVPTTPARTSPKTSTETKTTTAARSSTACR